MKKTNYSFLLTIVILLLVVISCASDDDNKTTTPVETDTAAPQLLMLFPESGASDVPVTTKTISLVFNEVVKPDLGNIEIYKGTDTTPLWSIPIGSPDMVSIKQALVSVKLPGELEAGQDYYVNIASGALTDVAENVFGGFSDQISWAFSTPAPAVGVSAAELVLHLPFDSDLQDISGNLLHATDGATSSGAISFVNDAERGGVVYFGLGAYATLPDDSALRPLGDESFSVNFWIKHVATNSDPVVIGNSSWDSGGNPGWLIATDGASGYVPDDIYDNGHGWTVNLATTAPASDRLDWDAGDCDVPGGNPDNLGDNEWHMVTMVIDQTNKLLKVYSDGIQYTEPAKDNTYDLNRLKDGQLYDPINKYPINIWEDGTGTYNTTHGALEGHLDDLRFYRGALTPAEIIELYTAN